MPLIFLDTYKSNIKPDLVTDQTSAHDPLNGYVPNGMNVEEATKLRKNDPKYNDLSLKR